MKKIASFTVNHIDLLRGVYVSRKDQIGENTLTTFDLRLTRPNLEPVMNTAEIHTIEHLAATYLRNHPEYADQTIYFGPMGCRTGFYLILTGDLTSKDVLPLIISLFEFVRDFEGTEADVPGATARDCGNYLDMNLNLARYVAKKYLDETLYQITPGNLNYPE